MAIYCSGSSFTIIFGGFLVRVCGDLEANGLLHWTYSKKNGVQEAATTIWCGVFQDLDSDWIFKFLPHQLDEMCLFLDNVEYLAGHNFADFDIPLMEKLLGYTFEGEVFDTFIVSQLTNPDRAGGHGLDPWGKRFGIPKPVHEDWTKFSGAMLHRCEEDVKINVKVYHTLLKELGYA